MYFSSMSLTCGRWPLPQQLWKRTSSSGRPSMRVVDHVDAEAEVLAVLLDVQSG